MASGVADEHFKQHIHVFIFGHDDRAGNPVDRETHERHLKIASDKVKAWFPNVEVKTGYVEKTEAGWEVRD